MLWTVRYDDGSSVKEDPNGQNFDRDDLLSHGTPVSISLGGMALVSLVDGSVMIGDSKIHPSLLGAGRPLKLSGLSGYAEGMTQYKVSNPVSIGQSKVTPASFNIGYVISPGVAIDGSMENGLILSGAQVMVSVDSLTMEVSICVSATIDTMKDGVVVSSKRV